MSMRVVLPDIETRATFLVQSERPMNDDQFFEFCSINPQLRIERTAQGEIIIMPPAGFETGYRNSDLSGQLRNWAKADGRGVALDSSTEYLLPNGAARSPDASWVLKSRLAKFTKEQKKRFLPLCPDFVIELISPSDRLNVVKAKMCEWIENGAELAWLIDADRRIVHIYRSGQGPQEAVAVNALPGDGPVQGFVLALEDIWRGL